MDRLSNHINKTIIDITSATELGTLSAVAINGGLITHIVSSSGKAIATGDIVCMNDYITVSSCGNDIGTHAIATDFGGKAICAKGKLLGIISDYEYTKNYQLRRVFCDDTPLSSNKISVFNQKLMIFKTNNYVKRINSEDLVASAILNTTTVPDGTPNRPPVSDYSFLVGRIITRDIYIGQTRLFCSGNTITDAIVSNAKSNNKLVELTLYSQKNI